MIFALLVSRDKESLSKLADVFEERGLETSWASSGEEALSMISDKFYHLVVTDENLEDMTGLELIKKIVALNPMVNCAAVSSLSPEDFHEAYEGLGVLMELSPSPGRKEGEQLLSHLEKIFNLE